MDPLPLGRVLGFRGNAGEMTVRVASGEAARWVKLRNVILLEREGSEESRRFEVERARGYRDRLVLKLRGVDDASAAEALKGRLALAPADEVPELPPGVHFMERLLGLRVVDERGKDVGTVADVTATGGTDLLVVRGEDRREILVPLAEEFVASVDPAAGTVVVRLPEELRDLNRAPGERP